MFLDLRYKDLLDETQKQAAICELSNLYDRLELLKAENCLTDYHEKTIDELELALMENDPEIGIIRAEIDNNDSMQILTSLVEFKTRQRCKDLKKSALDQWKELKKHPLYPLSNVTNAAPSTQSVVERANSSLNFVFSNRRCNLSKEVLDDIMVVHLNEGVFYALSSSDWQVIINHELESAHDAEMISD